MSKSNSPVQSLLAGYWRDKGLALSQELLDHQEFLMQFQPTGNRKRDLSAFLIGVGHQEMLEIYRGLNLPLDGLAELILERHRKQIARVKKGKDPEVDATYYRRNPEALQVYQTMLQLEEKVLTAILDQERSSKAA